MASDIEYSRAQQLRQRQRAQMKDNTQKETKLKGAPKNISIIEGIIMASFLFVIIDVPKYIFEILTGVIPIISFLTLSLAFLLWLIGIMIIIIWLGIKGKLSLRTIGKNWISFLLAASLFVVLFMVRERAEQLLPGKKTHSGV
jgi:hypothetical protein